MTDGIEYLEELYHQWRSDETSVTAEWREFFQTHEQVSDPGLHRQRKTTGDMVHKQSRVDSLLWAYRDVGYLQAKLNPLADVITDRNWTNPLSLSAFGLASEDLGLVFSAGRSLKPGQAALRTILDAFKETYCSRMGAEFLHIQDKQMRSWLIEKMESTRNKPKLTREQRKTILDDLIKAEEFEHFLHTTFIGQKRFSLEGAEVVIPALHFLVNSAHSRGITDIVIGTTHRGRLTILNRILGKPAREIFSEFQDVGTGLYGGSGDVKYHLGYSLDHIHPDGSSIHVTLVANPSHLESVGPVVLGKTRAVQERRADSERRRVVPIILHGDAAFSGQGVVAEVFNLSQLRGYGTGGAIHLIINNQIGFTTSMRDARSTFFPTDVAKAMPVPIFHVNGDHPEIVAHALDLALQFRQTFQHDAVVDVFCYRRHGHNEGDEPSFTHPRMYTLIEKHPGIGALYGEFCDQEGITDSPERTRARTEYRVHLRQALKEPPSAPPRPNSFQGSDWTGLQAAYTPDRVDTGVAEKTLHRIAHKLTAIPEGFHIHPKLKRILHDKQKSAAADAIDWAFAESLAFGTLLVEGIPVRLSGQDSARGTFSQRHSVWWDVESSEPKPYVPLNTLDADQAVFSVFDSPLSEYSVLGFEYGFSLSQPKSLIMWEAQFGDFCNGAQVIIDNYIASAEAKWARASGLALLLPHGYEGQGPEHSSAHLERFLQLCAHENIQVCIPTTPAQYFHLLRRQMRRSFRKPLIIMTPKSLLRHPLVVSTLGQLAGGSFREIMDDGPGTGSAGTTSNAAPRSGSAATSTQVVRMVCFCAGKIYYDLLQARQARHITDVALLRIEQLHPFPRDMLKKTLKRYKDVQCFRWVQEEPANRGAWAYFKQACATYVPEMNLQYAGREASASPATGSYKQHISEQQAVVQRALDPAQRSGP